MKTAVSLPDPLFLKAEATARRMNISRSQLYAKAISELLEREDDSAITDRLNQVYSSESSSLDPALHRAQLASLPKDDWG